MKCCKFFGDIILRKEDVKCCQSVVPGDVITFKIDEPLEIILVRPGKTLEEKGE